MTFNPSPKIAAARDYAAKHGKQIVIIIGIDDKSRIDYASYGATRHLCGEAKNISDVAFEAITRHYAVVGQFDPPPVEDFLDADPDVVQNLLSLCLPEEQVPDTARLGTWTREMIAEAGRWAAAVHLAASDNRINIPRKPKFI